MHKSNFALFAILLMLSACSAVGGIFGSSEEEAVEKEIVVTHPAAEPATLSAAQLETLNDNLRLIRENRVLEARLAAAAARNAKLEARIAQLTQKQVKPVTMPVVRPVSLVSSADVEIYQRDVVPLIQQKIASAVQQRGFSPKYPSLPDAMGMASKTTVFYYDRSYISTAGILAQELAAVLKVPVAAKKGASSFARNKIIIQIIGSDR